MKRITTLLLLLFSLIPLPSSLLHLQFPLLNLQLTVSPLSSLSAKPVTYIWDMSELAALAGKPESEEYKSLVSKANRIIKIKPIAVTNKETSISGDKHNYESLSIYWWPDPKNPGGPYVARDGEFNPEYKKYDYPRLLQLKDNLVTCSKAFFLTGDSATTTTSAVSSTPGSSIPRPAWCPTSSSANSSRGTTTDAAIRKACPMPTTSTTCWRASAS